MVDGLTTRRHIKGSDLVDQFELPGGFLLISDFKDPWDESTHLTLLDEYFRVVSRRSLGYRGPRLMRQPFSIKMAEPTASGTVQLTGLRNIDGIYMVEVRDSGIPVFRPRLKVSWQAT